MPATLLSLASGLIDGWHSVSFFDLHLPPLQLLLCYTSGLAFMALHELAHAAFAVSRGGRITRMGIKRPGNFYVQRPRLASHRDEILCALVGPAVHGAFALLLLSDNTFLHATGVLNFWMAIGNLLLPHSDGRRAWTELRTAVRA